MNTTKIYPLLSLFILVFCATSGGFAAPANPDSILFSHQKHVQDAGAACVDCHKETADDAGNKNASHPKMATCGTCHQEQLDAKNCAMCHTNPAKAKPYTAARKHTNFSHKAHLDRGAACKTCHKGLENLVGRTTIKNMPAMDDCYTCHDDKKARKDCNLCHSDLSQIKPASHKTIRFLKEEHGKDARFSSRECEACHQQNWCDQCHQGQLSIRIHNPNYRSTHGREARRRDKNCAMCHELQNQCVQCHAGRGR